MPSSCNFQIHLSAETTPVGSPGERVGGGGGGGGGRGGVIECFHSSYECTPFLTAQMITVQNIQILTFLGQEESRTLSLLSHQALPHTINIRGRG